MREILLMKTAESRVLGVDKPIDIPQAAWTLALKLQQSFLCSGRKYTLESWARLLTSEITTSALEHLAACRTQDEHNHLVDNATSSDLRSWFVNAHEGKSLRCKQVEALKETGYIPGEAYLNFCKLEGNSTLFLVVEPKFCCFYP